MNANQTVVSRPFFCQAWQKILTLRQVIAEYIIQAIRKAGIIFKESFAVLVFVLPNAIKWQYRLYIKSQIIAFKLNQTACLYLQSNLDHLVQVNSVTVLLHGNHSHPSTLLHLADEAQGCQSAVFSLYLNYRNSNPALHRDLIQKALNEIEALFVARGKKLPILTAVCHSRGSVEITYLHFCQNENRIQRIISFAGRLKVVPESPLNCQEPLTSTVNQVYLGIQANPTFPIYQIAAEKDWMVPLEAAAFCPNAFVISGALHLNLLYDVRAIAHYKRLLKGLAE